jgi:WhiB family redox-sensing transcriptional regulator
VAWRERVQPNGEPVDDGSEDDRRLLDLESLSR